MLFRPFALAATLLATLVVTSACTIQTPLAEHSPTLLSQTPDAQEPADGATGETRQLGNPSAVPQ